jgi:hypothetical protein
MRGSRKIRIDRKSCLNVRLTNKNVDFNNWDQSKRNVSRANAPPTNLKSEKVD